MKYISKDFIILLYTINHINISLYSNKTNKLIIIKLKIFKNPKIKS